VSDHDLLIKLNEKIIHIETMMKNHLAHHWAVTVALIGITATAIVSTLLLVLRLKME